MGVYGVKKIISKECEEVSPNKKVYGLQESTRKISAEIYSGFLLDDIPS